MKARIAAIDGLRGIAILLVVGFHSFSGHLGGSDQPVDPLRAVYGTFPLFRYGYLGVMLFFAISGFVISQSLHGSSGPWSFAVRRFARLWPTMLLCCTATYLVSFVTPGQRMSIDDFLPSLTFLDPQIFNRLFRTNRFQWMDDVYWSLFAEVRFYAIAAIAYFANPRHFFGSFLAFSCCVGLVFPLAVACDAAGLRGVLNMFCIAGHLPWFTLGIGASFAHAGQLRRAALMCGTSLIFIALNALAYLRHPVSPGYDATVCAVGIASGFAVLALLITAVRPGRVADVLAGRLISSIGVASYSLYLLHRGIGDRLLDWVGNPLGLSALSCGIYPALVTLGFILCSKVIYRFWETPLNRLLVDRLLGPRPRREA